MSPRCNAMKSSIDDICNSALCREKKIDAINNPAGDIILFCKFLSGTYFASRLDVLCFSHSSFLFVYAVGYFDH